MIFFYRQLRLLPSLLDLHSAKITLPCPQPCMVPHVVLKSSSLYIYIAPYALRTALLSRLVSKHLFVTSSPAAEGQHSVHVELPHFGTVGLRLPLGFEHHLLLG